MHVTDKDGEEEMLMERKQSAREIDKKLKGKEVCIREKNDCDK